MSALSRSESVFFAARFEASGFGLGFRVELKNKGWGSGKRGLRFKVGAWIQRGFGLRYWC